MRAFETLQETAHILNYVTEKSLVIIDELGRGYFPVFLALRHLTMNVRTSNIDGLSIAYAVGEFLGTTQAYVFFITHYQQL